MLEWFAEAGMALEQGEPGVPEPPVAAVREALLWADRVDPENRRLRNAMRMAGELGADALYEEVTGLLTSRPSTGQVHPEVVRSAVLEGERPPEGPPNVDFVHLVAAACFGSEEVGADALAEALAVFFPLEMTATEWAEVLRAAERGEDPQAQSLVQRLLAELAAAESGVERASDAELVRARTVLLGLQPFYLLYMLHGLLLPDTSGLAALREVIDDHGMGKFLTHFIAFAPTPLYFAHGVAACIDSPAVDALYEALMEQYAADPNIFGLPGNTDGFLGFIEVWFRTLEEHTPAAGGQAGSIGAKVSRSFERSRPGLEIAVRRLVGWALAEEGWR
ncbi:hypothetical protein SAMN05428938_8042 [Streptomyces sp. KS_5]|nr:hypothetical protein SAMN05428938_8042 [Streptomyces sp. KS_5]